MPKKSVVESNEHECFVCGETRGLECHHIFGGNPGRKLSERYGLTVHLCFLHHRDSAQGVHFNKGLMDKLHETGQLAFEKSHNREEFMNIFKRNYITQTEESRGQQEEEKRVKEGWGGEPAGMD